jgi:Cdc6-like AAA superfamily ATPase
MSLQSSSCQVSEWIGFLRQYGPIPRNDNMYDETIQLALRRKKIKPISFETEYLEELLDNFKAAKPKSVILTGTAGDGKTYYCREIWEQLGGSSETWNQSQAKIRILELGKNQLVIVKDLSELTPEEKLTLLPQVAAAIIGNDTTKVYLIAANDGQLIEAWAAEIAEIREVRPIIEDLLVEDLREKEGFYVRLYNLSRQSAAIVFPRILDAVLKHPGWQVCDRCPQQSLSCPIWENKLRLEGTEANRATRERLTDLLELCELNEMHLPVRQLLLLVANSLLGHPDAKDKLLACQQVPKIVESGTTSLASLYRNIFGENLPERRRESTQVFKVLRSFGIGTETSNQIDNILIFGADDPELQPYYEHLVRSDSYYGADVKYQAQQKSYLEGEPVGNRSDFLNALQSQRQRLFFTLPNDRITDLKLWNLTLFHYAGEYLNDVYKVLQENKKVSKHILVRIVRGLNRIFTGFLVNNQDELILATSGSYSQAKISRVYEESISVTKKRGESISIELDKNQRQASLIVHLSPNLEPISLNLTLTRYEYLSRVAEGTLPSSFSQECYEDVLAFKSQVLKWLARRKKLEGEDEDSEEAMSIRLLEVNNDGIVSSRPLEIYL